MCAVSLGTFEEKNRAPTNNQAKHSTFTAAPLFGLLPALLFCRTSHQATFRQVLFLCKFQSSSALQALVTLPNVSDFSCSNSCFWPFSWPLPAGTPPFCHGEQPQLKISWAIHTAHWLIHNSFLGWYTFHKMMSSQSGIFQNVPKVCPATVDPRCPRVQEPPRKRPLPGPASWRVSTHCSLAQRRRPARGRSWSPAATSLGVVTWFIVWLLLYLPSYAPFCNP